MADIFSTEKKTEWRSWRERRRTGLGYSGLRCSLRIRTLPVAVSLSPPCLARKAARNRLSDLWKTTAIRTDYTRAVFSSPHPSVSSQSAGRIGRGVGGCNSLRRRFDCIFSAVEERNSCSRISLQPLSVTVISSSHLQLEKKGGDVSASVSPTFSHK